MRALRRVLVATVLITCVVPAGARAEPLARFASGVARTDGSRFVVVSRRSLTDLDGVASVAAFDERTRRTRSLPGGCPAPAVGSGFVLSACADRPWRVYDLARGTDQAIAAIPWEPPDGADEPLDTVPEIGSRWLAFDQAHAHADTERRYEDWRTGRVLPEPDATAVADLDRPALRRPLCRPLRRPSRPWDRDYHYDPPYAAHLTSSGTLVLERCGSRRRTVAAHRASSAQLADGILTWLTRQPGRPLRSIVHARMLRSGRTATWRLTRAVASAQHTARAVYVNVSGDTGIVLRAALPRT